MACTTSSSTTSCESSADLPKASLKNLCDEVHLPITGNTATLRERLHSFSANRKEREKSVVVAVAEKNNVDYLHRSNLRDDVSSSLAAVWTMWGAHPPYREIE